MVSDVPATLGVCLADGKGMHTLPAYQRAGMEQRFANVWLDSFIAPVSEDIAAYYQSQHRLREVTPSGG